jgi:hypothetical protein
VPLRARSVVVLLRRVQRLRVVIVFVDLPVSALVFLSFLCLSFGLGCAAAPACSLYRVVCYINIAGRKPISGRRSGDGLLSTCESASFTCAAQET